MAYVFSRPLWYTCSHQTPLPHDVLASCMLVDLNIWCVYVTKHMYFVAYLVVGFQTHLHLSFFNINTNNYMKGECKTVPSLCKRGGQVVFFLQNECFKHKVVVFLTFVTIYLICNPKPDKDNTCTPIHSMRVTPPCVLRVALFLPCVLRTAMFGLAYCVSFNNKTTIFGNLHKEDKMTVCCVHMYNH